MLTITTFASQYNFHDWQIAAYIYKNPFVHQDPAFLYTFHNFFHPFVGELVQELNRNSLRGMLDARFHEGLSQPFFNGMYKPNQGDFVHVEYSNKEIDVSTSGAYANYNWELFFHIPLTIAVHLSKSQRFAEAQRWFHFIFNPISDENTDDLAKRVWKFLAFRKEDNNQTIDEIIELLSTPELEAADHEKWEAAWEGYQGILEHPFQPHVVARTRPIAYKYSVVMKYLDNLIAWGDHLFQQDTIETINEATQLYVLAANILGTRPQRVPQSGFTQAKTFAQLKEEGLGPIGNALVDLEGMFPFNLAPFSFTGSEGSQTEAARALFGIGRTLYFCLPRNQKLLGYWDTVGDRLFKIRHCMNIAGVVRPLALFDPEIDVAMMVKAAAAGIDIASIVNGLNQPVGPLRSLTLIQKALELCGEVRGLGGALLAAIEKGDGEHLALVRQRHEIQLQKMAQEVRFLQWKSTQEAKESLRTSRATALERLHFYQRVLGLPADPNAPDTLDLSQTELNEENFDDAYTTLVEQYDKPLTLQKLPKLKISGDGSASQQSGATGAGRLYLSSNEDAELNVHLPAAKYARLLASAADMTASLLTPIPDGYLDLHYWGLGGSAEVGGGKKLAEVSKLAAEIFRVISAFEQDQAGMASRTAGHERRADDWILQHNLAAHEVMQIGRQILAASIAEQIARHEYENIQQQIVNAEEVDQFLHDKFSNEELYLWMQGEISRLYYEYYRFAFDTARKAEKTMKYELMRPELETKNFIKFNYWDGGRKGLLSGEALYLDVKGMEMAYHDSNKREFELTRLVSLRQLNPLALLTLKSTGSCTVDIPEWLFDRDCPGHFMRRIKTVAVSIPSVVGPYTSLNCTLSLLRSTIRTSALLKDGEYARQGSEDDRFVDYTGGIQSIVTSSGTNDSGLFETNLRDERFLPFEGAGVESTWKLDLPKDHRSFDYATISDVVLHIRYTARQGVDAGKVVNALNDFFIQEDKAKFGLLLSLQYDFPTEWAAFRAGTEDFSAKIGEQHFPYTTQGKQVAITGFDLYRLIGKEAPKLRKIISLNLNAITDKYNLEREFSFTANADSEVLKRDSADQIFLVVSYTLG